jgi:hypothetical protein
VARNRGRHTTHSRSCIAIRRYSRPNGSMTLNLNDAVYAECHSHSATTDGYPQREDESTVHLN